MCGIAGSYNFQSKEKAHALVQSMCNAISHRGPDAQGVWQNNMTTLGHRRLSIIDTSVAGNQPFFSADKKLVIAFNGEIYNYLELKKELSAEFQFTTSTDTEVMMAAYKKWGIDCVQRFFGMFGFALWDDDLQRLYVVRDRLGIKPIYYFEKNNALFFSSEIRALLQTGEIEKRIGSQALTDYLRYQTVHAPNTIIDGIKMLMPGYIMQLDAAGMSLSEYWSLQGNASKEARHHDTTMVKNQVHDLLQSSVELRMRADVPFGAFLSGGIDSSAVVGLMSRMSAHRIKTFAVTFHEKQFDESLYSSMIAKKFNTDHTEIRLHATDFLKLVPAALQAMDHPSGDGPNTYVVSKVTRERGVKMALSGLGGDEVFAGYDVFKRMKTLERRMWMNLAPRFMRAATGKLLLGMKPSVSSEKIAMSLASARMDFAHLYPIVRQLFGEEIVQSLIRDTTKHINPVSHITMQLQHADLEMLSKVSVAEMSTYMQNILLRDADQMSMAHALEVRVPFLDHRLVEYVLGVTDAVKYPHTPKQLLVDSLCDLLPREIIDRPKMGFTFPWEVWLKNELRIFCEDNLNALQQIEELNHDAVNKLWNRFLNSDPRITWSRIWPLVTLGHWVKQHDVH
ncbi:MAG: asparagine synthase (glutamine-hydrolyzing) [Flavobacteriales bacterium]